MHPRTWPVTLFLALAVSSLSLGVVGAPGSTGDVPHAGMLRYPDVSQSDIVFVYANDLWIVPREGGVARPLASPPGQEMFPKFDASGERVVFQGNYDGGRDLYVMPSAGGLPRRLTHRPSSEMPTDWHPALGIVFFTGADRDGITSPRIYTVPEDGGLPGKLPVPYGANGVINADGTWLAYTPWWRDLRTWKRYRGGMASDIWLFNLETYESRQVTQWEGTDTMPMWHRNTLYYISDAGPAHRLNIWSWSLDTRRHTQVTSFTDHDVKFPSIGPGRAGKGEIVFQAGSELHLLDLRNGNSKTVEVQIPGARPQLRPRAVEAGDYFASGNISSTGKRAVVEARGDIWTIPAEHGPVRQITDTSGAAERLPSWSPDGRWIAYFSDADGEYELYLTQSDGQGETRQVTDGHQTYFFDITWSPDSMHVVLTEKSGNRLLIDIENGEEALIDHDPWAQASGGFSPASGVQWSSDSRWITWSRPEEDSMSSSIWLYDTSEDESHKLTSGFFNDSSPVFSRSGDYLFYASNRNFSAPIYDASGLSFVYANTGRLIAVPLTEDIENPWLIEPDEETWEEEESDEEEGDEEEDDVDTGEEAEEDENGEDAGDDNSDEEDPLAALDTEHPLFGKWEGTGKGFKAVGLPEDEISFSMIIIVDTDGLIMGSSTSMGETDDLGDVVTWDPDSMELTLESTENGITVTSVLTVSGDTMSGTWKISILGISGTMSATRTTRELEPKEIDEIRGTQSGSDDDPVDIDIEGFEERGMELPVEPGTFANLATNNKGQLLYVRYGATTPPAIKLIDVTDKEPEEKTVLGGAAFFRISGDGKKIIAGGMGVAIVSASPGQSFAKSLPTSGLRKIVDPRQEWEQLFTDAWRRHRDFFYVENMHGVDWDAVYAQYHAMLADAASREDVGFIIGEMISELNVGHAYYWGGDTEGQPMESIGLLGVDFELASETDADGRDLTGYRIARIYEGAPWDSDARGPLSQPGVDVQEGDFITEINGIPLETTVDPWAAFIGLTGKDTTITFASHLAGDEETRNQRHLTIRPIGSEGALRYRAWVEDNRRFVEETSAGRVGYIHVPDTGVRGQNELFRQFYGQIGKDALIIDERWNGGGQIPTRFIELLNRPRTNYWARRDGRDWPWPPDSHQGPKCMLINGMAGSGGDMFPWLFKHNGLGKLIGTRTWGGLVGISGVPDLIDGGYTAVPTFGFYETNGTWGIEGHGVDPDIEVIDDPTALAKGQHPQLEAAVALMLREIKRSGYRPARRPEDPDRSGIGITEPDH